MDTNSSSFNSGGWTNEKHLHYLKSMEASFVHTMFENNNNNNNNGRVVHTMFENNGRLLRLDRYLPDTSDSTLDLKTTHQRRKKKHAAAAAVAAASTTASGSRADKRFTGRRSYQPYASSQDQVVPQIGNRGGYKDESDSSDASSK